MQDLNDKVTGGTLTAVEWNEVPSELQNVIENLGIALSSGDLNQLGKGIAGYVANGTFYTDSGAADAYVLSTIGLKQTPTAYTDGMKIEFLAGNVNTGASTVNVASLGVKNIKLSDGTDPAAGDILRRVKCVFDLANDRFELERTGLSNLIIFTTSGSYSKPIGLKKVKVTAIGGGGGAAVGGASDRGGGGGGAAAATSLISAVTLVASETVTIGAGGSGGGSTGASGTNGGDTTFGSLVNAGGGLLGSAASGGAGGTAATGTVKLSGSYGSDGAVGGGGAAAGGAGDGGAAAIGAGGGRSGNGFGVSGSNGGGGGAALGGASFTAGNGGSGLVIIEEFF